MLLSPPLLAFLLGLVVVLSSITVPNFIQVSTRYLGQLTTPFSTYFCRYYHSPDWGGEVKKDAARGLACSPVLLCYTTPRDVFMHNVAGYGSSYAEVFHPCFRIACVFCDCRLIQGIRRR